MSGKAIGMLEYSTVTQGMIAADFILKTAAISILKMQTVCPGKYIIAFTGGLGEVKASLEAAKSTYSQRLVDHFLLGNPSEKVLAAFLNNTKCLDNIQSLGIIETFTASSAIIAADAAAKAANVHILEIRLAREMCGKSYVLITGTVSETEEAIAHANKAASQMILDTAVIPNPSNEFWANL